MKEQIVKAVNRREFLKSSCLIGAGGILAAHGMTGGRNVFAAEAYPKEKEIELMFGQSVGGNADRTARTVTALWQKYLGARFKYSYHPGAAGELGWTMFGQKPDDGYYMWYGAMGYDVLCHVMQNPKGISLPGDAFYFAGTLGMPDCIYANGKSPYKDFKTLIDAARKKEINVAVSSLNHPVHLGLVLLNKRAGTKFRGVPYGGGSKARAAIYSGEIDVGASNAVSILKQKPKLILLGLFEHEHRFDKETDNAPLVGEALGLKLPIIANYHAIAVRTSFKEKHPDRLELLWKTLQQTYKDPKFYSEYAAKRGALADKTFRLWDAAQCEKFVKEFREVALEFKDLLKGK